MSPNAHGRVAPGRFAGGPGAAGLPLPPAAAETVDDVAQRRLAQPPQRLRRQAQRAVGHPLEEPLPAQLALQLGQRTGVDAGLLAELGLQLVEVDVLQRRPRVGLRQLLGQRVEPAQLLHRPGRLTQAHRVLAAEAARRGPVLPRPQPLQLRVELPEGLGQARVAEGLLRQLHQLGALLRRHRVEHPLGGRGALGQQVDQLVGVLRVLREELAVAGHELGELLLGVLPLRVVREQGVQVVEHLADALDVAGGDVLHRLLHAGEALVEQLPAEQVADLLVGLAGLGGAPVVGVELADRAAGVRRQRVELHLAEAGVVGVLVGQGGPFGLQRAGQQLADLLQRAVEPVVALQPAAPLPDLAGQVVEPAPALHAAAQQLPQRGARRGALHDVAADGVERRTQVDGRGEGVGAVGVRAVGVPAIVSGHAADPTPAIRATRPRRGRSGCRRAGS